MIKSLLSWCWQWKFISCVAVVGTLSTGVGDCVLAQIVHDETLGAESSDPIDTVIRGLPSDRIDGGATRGVNLFHSFFEFNVEEGRGAYFTNPSGIENILTRVTGGNPSNIFGRLGVLGGANLFLLNPNGIVFGPNASLDVQGSFLATTANALKLGDGGLFSASQPATSNLLTVSPSALLFNAIAAQPIINQSRAESAIGQPNSINGFPGLQVPAGQTLALVGGDVLLEGGNLTAAGGRIELGSVAGVGQVSLSQIGNRLVLGYDSVSGFGNISLSNGAFVDASGKGGGDVQIRGARLEMAQSSNILADTLGTQNGGEVVVRTTEEVVLREGSLLRANVFGSGTGGDVTIDTRRLLVRDGAQVGASTFGEGKGGSLQITASDSVELIGRSADGRRSSGLFAESRRSGDAGDLRIDTRRLLVRDGARISASTIGKGKGGSLQITASDSVEVVGTSADGQVFSVLSTQGQGSGDAGDLTIDTGRLIVSGGAQVLASAISSGKGGSLQITASDSVEVIGTSANSQVRSGLFVQSFRSGDAGDLRIDTERLLVRDGAQVSASTSGEGKGGSLQITASDSVELIGRSANGQVLSGLFAQSRGSRDAGDLRIDTRRLLVRDGAQVGASTFGKGKGGSLQITASDSVELIGRSADGQFPSGLFAQTEGSGGAGDLTIDTRRLLVRDGAVVSAGTFSKGKGGRLQITASDSVELIGRSADGRFGSRLFAESERSGDAGDLRIDTKRLLVRDGTQVSVGTFGEGKGGSLQITASDSVDVIGTSADGRVVSGLFAQSEGSGGAGDLTIDTGRLLVRDGALVSAGTRGKGKGGSLQITASDSIDVIGTSVGGQFISGLSAQSSGRGDAGNLTIDTRRLLVRDGAVVSAGTFGEGKGGSLQITASDSVEVVGTSANGQRISGLFAQSRGRGDAGDLRIGTGRLLVRDGAVISSSSTKEGTAGNINITLRDTLEANNGTITTSSEQTSGGGITITASKIRLFGDSDIRTNVARDDGGGGNINLTADFIVAFDDSDILAFARKGRGGDVTLNTPAFFGEDYRPAPKGTNPDTLQGNNQVDVNATGAVEGDITVPDNSFIQNSLTELPENLIDTDSLIASSCIARSTTNKGSFQITGADALPVRPGDASASPYPTRIVRTVPSNSPSSNSPGAVNNPSTTRRPWHKGDPIVEPQGVYRLPNGELIMSRECS